MWEKVKNNETLSLIFIIIFVIIAVILFLFIGYEITERTGYYIRIEDGTIYKKEILPEEVTGFRYIPMRYRIHIENNVEVYGNVIDKKNYYDVTEEIYSMYSVGDWFDIQNPKGLDQKYD